MVVSQRILILSGLLLGLTHVWAENSAQTDMLQSAPQLPENHVTTPPTVSGKHLLNFTEESPTLLFQEQTLPYGTFRLYSAETGKVLIESEASQSVVPPEVYLFSAQGDLLSSLSFADFQAENQYFLKPDRLSATLSLNRFPHQELTLLIVPAASQLEGFSEFESPANLMAAAQGNARVINEMRKVPHQRFGKIALHFKIRKPKDDTLLTPQNDSLPSGAPPEQSADLQTLTVSDETIALYQKRIQAARDAGDLNKAAQLNREASMLGIPVSDLLKE
ncbi:MalM family protein [Kiritimatiellota bacterium B12222]|nr:MalM family protein [Kiritimatiellota bacterium B12222]